MEVRGISGKELASITLTILIHPFDSIDGYDLIEVYDYESGLQAALFVNEFGGAILAYRGSEPSEFLKGFVYTDAGQAVGFETAQFNDAMDLAKELDKRFHYPVRYTGHSLGGGLAAASAIYSGGYATTFNPSGVHPGTISDYDPGGAEITNYIRNFDVLRVINTVTPRARLYGDRKFLGAAGTHSMASICRAVGCW